MTRPLNLRSESGANVMINQSKVTSGFDVEFLMGEEFIRYFLLCSTETGSIPWWSEFSGVDENNVPYRSATLTHPPSELQHRRLYPVHPDFCRQRTPFSEYVTTVYSNQETDFSDTAAAIQPGMPARSSGKSRHCLRKKCRATSPAKAPGWPRPPS